MISMLQDVIKCGIGCCVLVLKCIDLVGKIGIINDFKDGWFFGYNFDYVISVWVGFDQLEILGCCEYGGIVVLLIWIRYMGFVFKDKLMYIMVELLGIVSLCIDLVIGCLVVLGIFGVYFEMFKNEDILFLVNELLLGSFFGSLLLDDEGVLIDLF